MVIASYDAVAEADLPVLGTPARKVFRCSVCRSQIHEIRLNIWEHLPTKRSPWGPICVMSPQPLELPPPIAAASPPA
ncbi:MAG: hypothetical protein HOQ05_13390 [Corynebacteriales bacterium]|nr:hypothetical protein [Mycobacteriales bacterium]